MSVKKYVVDLTPQEREDLLLLLRRGRVQARKATRARILLKADEGLVDEQIAGGLHTGLATVHRVRRRFVEEGLQSALCERPRLGGIPKLTGKQQAQLIATACSRAPQGRARWTLRLLADKVVELGFAESISRETVRKVLKKPAEALAESLLVHSGSQRAVYRLYGRRARPV